MVLQHAMLVQAEHPSEKQSFRSKALPFSFRRAEVLRLNTAARIANHLACSGHHLQTMSLMVSMYDSMTYSENTL